MTINCDLCQLPIPPNEQNMHSCYMCGYGSRRRSNDTTTTNNNNNNNNNHHQNICDECTMKYECNKCGGHCCPKCAETKYDCCGKDIILCGSYCPEYINDDDEKSCAHEHVMKKLNCGHWGCNYSGCGENCLTCCKTEGGIDKEEKDDDELDNKNYVEIIDVGSSDEEEICAEEDEDDLVDVDESDHEEIDANDDDDNHEEEEDIIELSDDEKDGNQGEQTYKPVYNDDDDDDNDNTYSSQEDEESDESNYSSDSDDVELEMINKKTSTTNQSSKDQEVIEIEDMNNDCLGDEYEMDKDDEEGTDTDNDDDSDIENDKKSATVSFYQQIMTNNNNNEETVTQKNGEITEVHTTSTSQIKKRNCDSVVVHKSCTDAINNDRELLEGIMDKVQTDSLKVHLLDWLNTSKRQRPV